MFSSFIKAVQSQTSYHNNKGQRHELETGQHPLVGLLDRHNKDNSNYHLLYLRFTNQLTALTMRVMMATGTFMDNRNLFA